jgi:hypothetical protein
MDRAFSDELQRAPCGHFKLRVFRRGKLIEEMDEANLIVAGSKFIHAHLLGGNVANNSIVTFGVGTNALPAAIGNLALTAPYTNALGAITYPMPNQVQFSFGLADGEANGMSINEFGLLTGSGALYARKVRAIPLNKAGDISLTGTWTITF